VGKAKAGWGLAAAACGNTRGLPVWATGAKHPEAAGGAQLSNSGTKPRVVIYTRVSYAQAALPGGTAEPTRIAHENLVKRMKIIARAEARRAMAA
jgi:hypothetical protein